MEAVKRNQIKQPIRNDTNENPPPQAGDFAFKQALKYICLSLFLRKYLSYTLFFLILVFLFCNMVQDYAKFNWQSKQLDGFFVQAQKDTFSWSKWFDGSYPEKTTAYLNENFGFRNFYVRLYNEQRFLLFRKTVVKDMIIGKNDYLYQWGQVMEYNGDCCIGEKAVNDTVQKLVVLKEKLATLGKKILVVLAPNKVRVYAEFMDQEKNRGPVKKCNYEFYRKSLAAHGVDFIDFNQWFGLKKDTSRYELIPKLGCHWSRLEAIRGADTILRRLSMMAANDLPEIKINRIRELDTMQAPDDDAIKSMNLLWYPTYKKMAYPEFEVIHKERAEKSILVVSDSFWWDIFLQKIPVYAFRNDEFWYYSKDAYGSRMTEKQDVSKIDVKRHILQADYILIIVTESNLSVFGFGFISKALAALDKEIKPTPQEVEDYKNAILDNKEWSAQIVKAAHDMKMPVDSALKMNINYMFQLHGPADREPTVEEIVRKIKGNPEWLAQIKKGAEEKGLNIDTAIRQNAEFVIWEGKNKKNK